MRFSEVQYIRNPLVWLLVSVVVVSGGMGLYKAIHISILVGLILSVVCVLAIITFLLMMPLSLRTVVDDTELRVTIYPISFAQYSIELNQIKALQVVTTAQLKSDLDQIQNQVSRLNFVVGGKFALRIVSISGKEILVSTHRPGELFRALCDRQHKNT